MRRALLRSFSFSDMTVTAAGFDSSASGVGGRGKVTDSISSPSSQAGTGTDVDARGG